MTAKEFFFRFRSYTPLPLALVLLYSAEYDILHIMIGLIIIVIGESVRITGLRDISAPSRTRDVGAPALITHGMYSRVRNPLYVGNFIIYIGVAVFGGGPWFLWVLLFTALYFWLQYTLIVGLEEEVLEEKFGDPYREYCREVPRLLPRLRKNRFSGQSYNKRPWPKTFKIEKSSFMSISALLIALCLKFILL